MEKIKGTHGGKREGSGRKKVPDKKITLTIVCSAKEKKQIDCMAIKKGVNRSCYVMNVLREDLKKEERI